ncbi:CBS domain-containing protein [Promicromonospora sukumoe]|uniref:CBS domain-containing protein n=1 Tax=Promicromonospora sukumoe TaxID=88382 RepID=UPI000378F8C7|nr:CBS domain-containing protein [Promicromonospora sukumoe]
MTPVPATVQVTETLRRAAREMVEHDVGALVVHAGRRAIGVVTDRDLVVRGLAAGLGTDATVQQVTNGKVIAVGHTDLVEDAFEAMHAAGVRRVPVLDGDTLVGLLTFGDLGVERDPSLTLRPW